MSVGGHFGLDDPDAARVELVWLLIPGATALADRLRDLSPEIGGLVAGQLWIEVPRSHHLGRRGTARAILNETRRKVTAELGVGHQARLRDKVWAEIRLLDRFEAQAVLVEPPAEDPYDEMLELLDAALRDEALAGSDLWLLHELATEATAMAAPMRRGRCGLTSGAVVERAARQRPEAPRTPPATSRQGAPLGLRELAGELPLPFDDRDPALRPAGAQRVGGVLAQSEPDFDVEPVHAIGAETLYGDPSGWPVSGCAPVPNGCFMCSAVSVAPASSPSTPTSPEPTQGPCVSPFAA